MPTSTLLGGVCPVPRAWRKMDMTMMMRTNEVIMSSSEGSKLRVVISASNCKDRLYCMSLPELLTLTKGMPCDQATAGSSTAITANAAQRQRRKAFMGAAPAAAVASQARRRYCPPCPSCPGR